MKAMKKVFKFKKDVDEFDIPKNVQGIIPLIEYGEMEYF